VKRPYPIEDHYGTQISVEVVGHSVGYMVDLDRVEARWVQGGENDTFDSLTAEQARDLAGRLIAAAEEIEAHS
jgi:hypothetical protein